MEATNTAGMKCDFISYKISEDAVAEAFINNGITDIAFDSTAIGVRVVRSEDGLIFAREGGELTLPQMIFLVWCGGDIGGLNEEEKALFDNMDCVHDAAGKADSRSCKLETAYSGSPSDKLRVMSELFAKTDIADRLDYTVTRVSKGGMETDLGVFGLEKISYVCGRISYMLLVPAGMGSSEDNAALLLKDGELTVSDKEGFVWQPEMLARALFKLNETDAPKGVNVLKKISCGELKTLILPTVLAEVCEGALCDCPALTEVVVLKPNVLLNRGFAGSGVTVVGLTGSSAKRYAEENGLGFKALENVEYKPKMFAIADGVCVAADTAAVFRRQSDSRASLNDIRFTPYDGAADDFDCEIIELAESAELTAQLESFGSMTDTETIRNDRSGYIKATMMKSAQRQDIFGYVLEIDRDGRVICLHTEKQFDAAELEKGAEKALFERIKELGASVEFGVSPANIPAEMPVFVIAEVNSAEENVREAAAEESAYEPAVEEYVAPEAVSEEPVEPIAEETPIDETAAEEPAYEFAIEEDSVPETAAEESAYEPAVGEDAAPEAVSEEPVESIAEETPIDETAADSEQVVDAEILGEQENTRADEIIDVEPEDIRPADEPQPESLVRGARFDLREYMGQTITVDMDYQAEAGLDIDGYLFLLKADGKVRSDADLIFFGQKVSVDGAVANDPANTRSFTIDLSKLDSGIAKLSVAYAIYGDNAEQTFARVSKPTVRISCNGRELCSYEPEGLSTEKSTVAIELYNKDGWKLRTIGLGYKEALKSLCANFGVEVK